MSDNTITREDGFGAAVEFYQRMADDLRLQLAERDAYIAQLREALQELCDLQNGPPSVRGADRWQAAMRNARALLGEKEE